MEFIMKKIIITCLLISICHLISFANSSKIKERSEKQAIGSIFIENKGQWPDEVKYLAKSKGMNTWITNNGVVYDFYKIENTGDSQFRQFIKRDPSMYNDKKMERTGHVVKMGFNLKNTKDQTQGIRQIPGKKSNSYFNYFLGNDSKKWKANVPAYDEITTENVFDGIDIRYYYDKGSIRYDFIVEPGADPSKIKMNFDLGQNSNYNISISPDGDLLMNTSIGVIKNQNLLAYQKDKITGEQLIIPCTFELNRDGTVGFNADNYDRSMELIIDPLVYSTFLGGNSSESFYGIEIDDDENVILGGGTISSDFPLTAGAYTHLSGSHEAWITKLNSTGTDIIFSSVFGGSNIDYISGLDIDADGNIYAGGGTYSNDFPTTSDAFDDTYYNRVDCFLIKLSSDGSELLYSTYFGGNGNEDVYSVVVSPLNEVYLNGMTSSETPGFPITNGAYDNSLNGYYDCFIMKFNSNLSILDFSTYIGGIDYDGGWMDMKIDDIGNVYFTGISYSTDYPTTVDAYSNSLNGEADILLTILNNSGSDLLYSTFIGGSLYEQGRDLELLNDGRIVILGQTGSPDFPTTIDAYNTSFNGGSGDFQSDIVIVVLEENYQSLNYSTFIGGSDNDFGFDMILDENENVIYTGATRSSDYPVTSDAFSTSIIDDWDMLLTRHDLNTKTITYSTYFGGTEGTDPWAWEDGWGLVKAGNDIVFAGHTYAPDFPITSGAFDEEIVDMDITVTRLSIGDNTPPNALCKDIEVLLENGSASITPEDIDNGSSDESGIASMEVHPNSFECGDIGENEVTLTVIDNYGNEAECTAVVEIVGEIPSLGILVNPSPAVNPGGEENTIYLGYGPQSITLTATEGFTYNWSSDPSGFTSDEQNPTVSPSVTTEYTVEVSNEYGCTSTESAIIYVHDYQAGKNNHQMWICHEGRTIRVSKNAVAAHLRHGDLLGPCSMEKFGRYPPIVGDNYTIHIFPNPADDNLNIQLDLPEKNNVEIKVFDLLGIEHFRISEKGISSLNEKLDISSLAPGTYFIQISVGSETIQRKIVKE